MATKENINWKRINMGDILPCQSFLRKKDGEILKLSTSGGVKVGQDCYYLPVDEVINVIKDFPVEESKDERIRKTLVAFFTDWHKTRSHCWGISVSKILDWLEKQGEKKPILDVEIPFGAKDSELEEASYSIPNGYHAEIEDNKVVVKKGEQKPIKHNNDATIDSNLNDYCCKVYNALHKENGGNLSFGRLQHLAMDIYKWCKEQQTPAEWGKEDEFHFKSIESTIEYCKKEVAENDDAKYLCNEDLNWFKSLKDRVQPQRKKEWSEEDEYYLNRCITKIEIDIQNWEGHGKTMIDSDKEIISWLKSIKDRVGSEANCTTTKEWSEEDGREVAVLRAYLSSRDWSDSHINRALDIVDELVKKLKSLRSQNKNTSKEFKDTIREVKTKIAQCNGFNKKNREEVFGLIDSLRPQSSWKPSDDQMRVLDLAIKCGINRGTTDETTLVSLFNDLKKLKG